MNNGLRTVDDANVFLVGLRYSHHAHHSGYEAFGRYVARFLEPSVRFRWLGGRLWPVSVGFARAARHPWYSPGALLIEVDALAAMLRHRNRLYHMLYGDSDLWLIVTTEIYTHVAIKKVKTVHANTHPRA